MTFRIFLLLAAIGCPLPSIAQTATNTSSLTSDEIRDELYGVILEGTTDFSEYWTECIDENGDTVYYYAGEVKRGKMALHDTGVICFSYDDADTPEDNCFVGRRSGSGQYVFDAADGFGSRFMTTRVIRNVDVCPEEAPALS